MHLFQLGNITEHAQRQHDDANHHYLDEDVTWFCHYLRRIFNMCQHN